MEVGLEPKNIEQMDNMPGVLPIRGDLIDQVYPFPIRPSVALSYASRYPAGNGNGNSRNGGVEELLGM